MQAIVNSGKTKISSSTIQFLKGHEVVSTTLPFLCSLALVFITNFPSAIAADQWLPG